MMTNKAWVGLVCAVAMMSAASAYAAPDTVAAPAAPAAKAAAVLAKARGATAKPRSACPALSEAATVSPATTRFFQTITDACVLRASGLIGEDQFVMIRDQAVNGIYNEMLAASNESQDKMVASVK